MILALSCSMFLGGCNFSFTQQYDAGTGEASVGDDPTTVFPYETNSFTADFLIGETNQEAPFFEAVLPAIKANIAENNTHSITKYYDQLPLANNPENFQGLGHATYANINGKTVTAEAFFRVANESLADPNAGMGLLIYQCILYKLARPDEDVKITFSSYRTSVTASVCVLPESKYYGYMRSLYGTNYDEHGFVRISYMLVEAARMGIEVTLVHQLPSYSVQQYNPTTGKLASRSHIHFQKYFDAAIKTACYNTWAPGKKVSDFMNSVTTKWTVNDQTSSMQHIKSASVSHYLATDGTEHESAVFFGSANLDENNYKGCNGNNGAQSGVIVSDHDEIYQATYNYMQLMTRFAAQEQMQELRKYVHETNIRQTALILAGKEDEIPADEKIVYLGSETDNIFELYFTPLGSSPDTWDVVHNPICKYVGNMPYSTDYVEFFWNEFGFGNDYVCNTLTRMLEMAYCDNPNPNNKISLRVPDFDGAKIAALQVGTEIGACSIKGGSGIHSKDLLMSYEKDGQRHYVSILTSCNFYMIAFNYRTNSILVIHETDETGNAFYKAMGVKYSYGMLEE